MRKPQWCVRYKDIFGNKKVESFTDKDKAQSFYEDMLPRTYGDLGDIESVSAPVKSFVGEAAKRVDWNNLEYVVRSYFKGIYPSAGDNRYFVCEAPDRKHDIVCDGDYDNDIMEITIDFRGDDVGKVTVANTNLTPDEFNKAFDLIKELAIDVFSESGVRTSDYPIDIIKVDKNEDCGSSAASLGAVPTAAVKDDESVVRTRRYGR